MVRVITKRKDKCMSNDNDGSILRFTNHWNDDEHPGYWEDVCECLKDIFPNGIYSMSSQAFGWDRDRACRVVNGDGEKLLRIRMDASFAVFEHGNHWSVKIAHHDSPMGDLFLIHKHETEDAAQVFLRGLGHRI